MAATFNWFLVLQLDFDSPDGISIDVLNERINSSKIEWAKKQNDAERGAEFGAYLKLADKIADELSDPDVRKELAEQASSEVYKLIDKYLKMIANGASIEESKILPLVNKLTKDRSIRALIRDNINEEIILKRIRKSNYNLVKPSIDHNKIYNQFYVNPPSSVSEGQHNTFKGMRKSFELLQITNLYEFIGAYNSTPLDSIKQKISEVKESYRKEKKQNNLISAGRQLCTNCESIFASEQSKKSYDDYLFYLDIRSLLDDAEFDAKNSVSGGFSSELFEQYKRSLVQRVHEPKLAKDILLAFCSVKGIACEATEQNKEASFISCSNCGKINDVTDNRHNCADCGTSLYIKCPKCGTEDDANVNVCKSCGLSFVNIRKSLEYCRLACREIESLEFESARGFLKDAKRLWADNKEIPVNEVYLTDKEKQLGSKAIEFKKAINERRYVFAKEMYLSLQHMFPKYANLRVLNLIDESIEEAKVHYDKAIESSGDAQIENLTKAYDLCVDYPGISDLATPPDEPTNLSILVNTADRVNELTWTESKSKGKIHYYVLRKKTSSPRYSNDGELLTCTDICAYTDKNIVAGEVYYYAVFSERIGVFSTEALPSPISTENLFEIRDVSLQPSDKEIVISCRDIPVTAQMSIYSITDQGNEKLICSSSNTEFSHKGLTNEKTYKYHICLSYTINNRKQETTGVTVSAFPIPPRVGISKLSIIRLKQSDRFSLRWESAEGDKVRFFYSHQPSSYKINEIVTEDRFLNSMNELVTTKSTDNSAVFEYSDDRPIYVTVVTQVREGFVIGSTVFVVRNAEVTIKEIRRINGKIHIFVDTQKNISQYVVLYKYDSFPVSADDKTAECLIFTDTDYNRDRAIVISSDDIPNNVNNVYFTVVSKIIEGGSEYSVVDEKLFSAEKAQTLTYSVKKPVFSKSVKVSLSVDNPIEIPELILVAKVGALPVAADARGSIEVGRIKPCTVKRTLNIDLPIPASLQKQNGIYAKLFLSDNQYKSMLKIQQKMGENGKII
jgi:hypothetical protein